MSKKRKFDLEAILFMHVLHLKEEVLQEYTGESCDLHKVYVFPNEEEFLNYFYQNGLSSEKLIALCKMRVTKKGTIIALKKLCDYTIASYYGEVLQNPFASGKVLTKSSN